MGVFSECFDTNSAAEPERSECFGEISGEVIGEKFGEDIEVGGVGGGVDRIFGCVAGFGLSGEKGIDRGGDVEGEEGGVDGLETTGFGFFVW